MKKRVISLTIATILAGTMFASGAVEAKGKSHDEIYRNAYNAVVECLNNKDQRSINKARENINDLKGNVDWAIGEFSKQVDTVQQPILVSIIDGIFGNQKNPSQISINETRTKISNLPNKEWKNSYSCALDIAQQKLMNNANEAFETAKITKTRNNKEHALKLINEICLSIDLNIKKWAENIKFNINSIVEENNASEGIIKDKNLERVIRKTINKPTGVIYREDLENITTLVAVGEGIENISGLENCKSLNKLDLGIKFVGNNNGEYQILKNNIKDVSPLRNLKNLNWISLQCNNIEEIDFKNQESLKVAFLGDNQIKNITLPSSIEELYLDNNDMFRIESLKGLENVKVLDISSKEVITEEELNIIKDFKLQKLIVNKKINIGEIQLALPNCKISNF